MTRIRDGTKYHTIIERIDIETGEIITESQYKREYYRTINKTKRYENREQNGKRYCTTIWQWECERNKQQRLFD